MNDKNVTKLVQGVIGFIWCVLAVYGIYFYYVLVMGEVFSGLPNWATDYIYWVVGGLAVVFYFVYDYSIVMVKRTVDKYLDRIIK